MGMEQNGGAHNTATTTKLLWRSPLFHFVNHVNLEEGGTGNGNLNFSCKGKFCYKRYLFDEEISKEDYIIATSNYQISHKQHIVNLACRTPHNTSNEQRQESGLKSKGWLNYVCKTTTYLESTDAWKSYGEASLRLCKIFKSWILSEPRR